jgi:hypothetical protein
MLLRCLIDCLPRSVRRGLTFIWSACRRRTQSLNAPCKKLASMNPWSSPNVWERVVAHYAGIDAPVLFEYGCGVSSIWHIQNLVQKGGKYISVDHNLDWYAQVLSAIVTYGTELGLTVTHVGSTESTEGGRSCYLSALSLTGSDVAGCEIVLKLSPPGDSGHGKGGPEGWGYAEALDEPCDVVIVDGAARKACVNYVLDGCKLKPGGLLALFEAGRGIDGWLGRPALAGENDYQPAVKRMLSLGGELMDGTGLDNWPGQKRRWIGAVTSYHYPQEACFLQLDLPTVTNGL